MSYLALQLKPKFLLGSLLLLSFLFLGVSSAGAVGDAYFPQDTTLTINSVNYTILAGSDADSVVANATTAVVTVSAGQSISITSAGRFRLDNDGGFTTTCTTSVSTLLLSMPVGGSSKTVTITPDITTVLCQSSGGSVGGGGSYSAPAATPTPAPSTSVSPTPTPTSTSVLGAGVGVA